MELTLLVISNLYDYYSTLTLETAILSIMVLLTMIGRSEDGLLLSASGINDNHDLSGNNSFEYQNQAKQLFKTLRMDSPAQMTIETGPYVFHYLLENRICYLCLCEKTFSKRLAFSFLEDLSTEFLRQYGQRPYTVNRPYSFIEFGKLKLYSKLFFQLFDSLNFNITSMT